MRNRTVTGVFDRPSDAEKAKDELLEAGVARHRIVIGGEVRNGACLVAVVARSPVDRDHIARLMRRLGARETVESRA
jgi:hypothetical protein